MSATGIEVRKLTKLAEFEECVALQRAVWKESDLETEPVTLFVVASHTGGQVLGAFDGGTLVGFTLALAGLREGRGYLHSHMTGVAETHRDRGVGRALKLFQRDEALGRDIRWIEWTFDPLETRNAHFNFNLLGCIARKYSPNVYGVTTSPLHRGIATDRLVAEWHLDSARVLRVLGGAAAVEKVAMRISLPAELEEWKRSGDFARVAELQGRVRGEFVEWFGKNYAVTSFDVGAGYGLGPWSEF
jgi:predicted GNAT superfamily acetyltransferase